jgi:two-component system NtrC family sensor kinase
MGERRTQLLKVKRRIGIGIRLALMVAVLMILSTGSFMLFSLNQQRATKGILVHSSAHMARSLEQILRLSMLENRRDEIESAVINIAEDETIESVTLVTHAGEVAYSSGSGIDMSVSQDDGRCSGCHVDGKKRPLKVLPVEGIVDMADDSKAAMIVLPIYNAPNCHSGACHAHSENETVLGVMEVEVSYDEIDKSLARSYRNLIIFSSLIAFATFIAIILLIRQWVTNPVRDLLRGTRRVAEGELGHVIPVGEGELGYLAQAFNSMQSKLETSQEQLITAEKLASIGKLAASVAHEINNPLTGILTFAEDLADEAEAEDPRLDDYKTIKREAIRCREIVRQLLDFSRQVKSNLRLIDINEILSHTVTFVSKQALFRNIQIESDLQKDLPPVTADSTQLEQVILGILVNASEMMPDGGKINITSSILNWGEDVEVSIQDTGPGIPEENLRKIFEPFFSTKGGSSLGIGLAVSWSIINQHGGRLDVDSNPGEGTTFRITLPCSPARGKTGAAN